MEGCSSGPTYTLDEALNSVGFGKFQGFALAYAGLGWAAEAMEVQIISFIGTALRSQWNLSSADEGLLTSVVFFGMLVGANSWGLVADKLGRKMGFLGMGIFTAGAGFGSAFAPNYIALLILQFFTGVGLGGVPVFLTWFLEFIPSANRGKWLVVFSTFWTLGSIMEASLAWIVMSRLNWRWLLALSAVPSSFVLLFFIFVPESPRYLCMKGRTADALNILEKIATVNRTTLPSGTLSPNFDVDAEESSPPKEYKLCSCAVMSVVKSILTIFSSKLIKTTLLLWVLFFGNSFSYYGIILLTTKLSSQGNKCGTAVLKPGTSSADSLYTTVFITSLAELPGLVLSALLVDRVGRKLSILTMFILGFLFLLPLIFHMPSVVTTILLFGARMCAMGTFTVSYIYAPELYPTSVRTTGFGITSSVGRIGGMVCPIVAVGLINACKQRAAIFLLEAVIAAAAVAVPFFSVETKGRDLIETP